MVFLFAKKTMRYSAYLLTLCWLLLSFSGQGQETDSLRLHKKKSWVPATAAAGVVYTGGLVGLSQIWYTDATTGFRFFNDNAQWKQLDKVGHAYSAYHLGRFGYAAMKNMDVSENTRLWLGGGLGFILLFPIEIMDGFAPDYGASWGDWGANLIGSLAFIAQQKWAARSLVQPKFSFRRTTWAGQRPEVLGAGLHEELLKDYNGQTYWLSLDMHGLTGWKRFPKWLNLAAGYGAEGMVFARRAENRANGFRAHRQYYLALDFDFSYLKPRSAFLKGLVWLAGCIKVPAPTLQIANGKLTGHVLYF